VRKRNCAMAKSAASTAWMPSCPLMPTPTCAAWIMLTSLAPSPMLSVTLPAPSRISAVTCRGPRDSHGGMPRSVSGLTPAAV